MLQIAGDISEILGVVNDVPVPTEGPPVKCSYQLIVPADAVAPKVTVPVPHLEPFVVSVIEGIEFIVAVTAVLGLEVQPVNVAST